MANMKRRQFLAISAACLLGATGCAASQDPMSNVVLEEHETESHVADYSYKLFDPDAIHEINVSIAEADWEKLLADPRAKEEFKADITIDGETFDEVSFSTKGGSTLSGVARMGGSSRYSFQVLFGQYKEGQSYHGLDSLSLNNLFGDATWMKDHISYKMFREMGVDAPLTSYARVLINGHELGFYMAVESVGDAFLERAFAGSGVMYMPESEPGRKMKEVEKVVDGETIVAMKFLPTTDPKGADLVYTDDEVESYPEIFAHNVTDVEEADNQRVIAALKGISEGKDLDTYVDTEEVIRYFAVHNYLQNFDSYSSFMADNYILHEADGKLSLFPWDYNTAFGTFPFVEEWDAYDDGTELVNMGIDSPLLGVLDEERPMWKWILDNESYLDAYHNELRQLVARFFVNGALETEINRVYEMILPFVADDPTAFYSEEQYVQAVATLKDFCNLRAESIASQLSGKLETRTAKQDAQKRVDASKLRVLDMGYL